MDGRRNWKAAPAPLAAWMLAAALAAGPAGAAVPQVKDAELAIYAGDLGLVREIREVQPPSGAGTLELAGLARRLDPSSVRITARGGWSVRGWSYRDAARGWLEAALDQKVRVLEVGDRELRGILVAADDGGLTVRREDGSGLVMISRAHVKEVEFAGGAGDVRVEPALTVRAEGRGGKGQAELAYLTGGLAWSAEHVVVREGEKTAEWSGSAVLVNRSGADFRNARIQLVAGEPHRTAPPNMPQPVMMMEIRAGKAAGGEPAQEAFADYHLYTLEGSHDLRDGETRSVPLLAARALKVTPRYRYAGQQATGVAVQLEVMNKKEDGLGVPIAAGRVRFYQRDTAGGLLFTGEDRVSHTPEGEKVTLDVGVAFDLVGERKQMADRRISDREREQTVEIKLRNRKKEPVVIVVAESLGGDSEIIRKTHDFTRKDANTIEFAVPVPADQEVRVEYTARIRW